MSNLRVMSELNPRSNVAEAFRILRTNLRFSTIDLSLKTLMVTSSGPSEGKSTIVANLGVVLAQNGARVIIVDCDLRWSEQHQLFGLNNDTGLTDLLAGKIEISEAIKETGLANLRVVTSGSLPPNPAELLGSEKTREVLSRLAELADFVLVDSPPLLAVADAVILSSIVDGCLLVVKTGETKVDALKQAKAHLNKANTRVVGIVLNAVEKSSAHYYDSYYYEKKNKVKQK